MAVIAVDPSSPFTGGALLGDRVRMAEVQCHDDVYIRSLERDLPDAHPIFAGVARELCRSSIRPMHLIGLPMPTEDSAVRLEGIGEDFLPSNVNFKTIDEFI